MAGGTGTNILANLELQRQQLAQMKQELMSNSSTALVADYTNIIAALTADKATVQAVAANNVDLLTQ